MSSSERLDALADCLAEARRDGRQVTSLPDDLIPRTQSDAYLVNGLVAARLGWKPLGWKIAGTTAAVCAKLGLETPIYGRTFRRFVAESPARFRFGELLDPLIECEFFVTLGQDLPPRDKPWTMAEIIERVSVVHAGIEVAECRFPAIALPPLTAILADGSASGRYVFGDPMPRWREGLAEVAVTLEVDGAARRRGTGADVMADPIRPLLWLAEERRRWGDGLRAGETISTGSMTGMLPIRAGQAVRALFGASAVVEISFDR
jgi:2-keto-4-pentenoate hydratase